MSSPSFAQADGAGQPAASEAPSTPESSDSDADKRDSGSLLGDIVVTARKREENMQSVPASISAFSSEQLRAVGVVNSKDIVKITPGLQWKSDSAFGGNNIFLRGVGTNSTQFTSSPAVAVYLDETYFNAQLFHGFATFDVDRVEVLKGPQGTLYGRNTTGGAIKYITKKPDIGEAFTADVKLDYGNFDSLKIEGGVGVGLGDKAALRLSFLSWDRDGIYYDVFRKTRTTDVDAKAVRLQLALEPTERLSILLSAGFFRAKSDEVRYKRTDYVDPTSIVFGPGGPSYTRTCANPMLGTGPGCTSFLQFFGAIDDLDRNPYHVASNLTADQSRERVKSYGGSATINYDLDFATLTSATSYYKLKYHDPLDVDGSGANISSINDDASPKQFSQEIRLTSDEGAFRWVLGGFYFHELIKQRKPVNLPPVRQGFGNATDQKTDSVSIFAEGTYAITDQLDLSGGLRWSKDKKNIDFLYFRYVPDPLLPLRRFRDIDPASYGPGTFTLLEKESRSNVSGRLVLSYTVRPGFMVYASANKGFKSGEFNVGADVPATAIFVKPETVNAYEFGIKSDFFDRRLRFNAAAFYYDYKDKQETQFDSGVITLSNADARIKGLEISAIVAPVDGLTLSAGLSLLDTKYTKFPNCRPDGRDCTGNRLPAAPARTVNLLARYEFDIAGRTAAIQGTANYQSHQFFDYQNVNYLDTPGYWLGGARVSYELSDEIELAGWIENISNKKYITDGYDVSKFGYADMIPGTPRTYGASLTVRY